ncbi:hypothetical protein F511_40487 [Dorcoceras hygrometricum]|uniref:Dystroglycan-like n=1 Tax=Dorcoceras hygrometricum TaxID=472368 RepID=A0A2Z7AGP0_9LAMI|nr:hypothetical protein F511_40487 [Dorcoceras hygrometricum]
MASSLFINTVHVFFESVLSMDNAAMVAMFESVADTGLKGFMGCPAIIHKAALLEFFANGSVRDGLVVSTVNGVTVEISEQLFAETFELPVEGLTDFSEIPKDLVFDVRSIVSLSGEPVSMSGKKKEMAIEFRLLCDILAKTIFVKARSFDAITQEKFLMMAAITCGVRINWNRLLFNIFKDMVTPGSRQAKGYAIQISLLLENVPNLELGESSEFPSSKVLTEKTVHRYIVLNDKVGMEVVTAEPRVKKTPVRKATRRPATDAAVAPVVKKKRTTKSKSVSSKKTMETLPVEAVPLQMIAPTPVAPAEQPSMPKRKTQKRKMRLILGSDDDSEPIVGGSIVGQTAAEVVGDTAEKEVEPVVESFEEQQAKTTVGISEAKKVVDNVDDVDVIIEQVIAETAHLEIDEGEHVDEPDVSRATAEDQVVEKAEEVECWFDLPYEVLIAGNTEQMVTTASDTDEEFIADQVFGIGVEEMETEDVKKSADEAMSLEDILMTIPVECPLPSAYVEITKIILGKTISIPGVNEGDWYKASLPKIPAADKGKAPLLERDPVKGNPIKEQFSLILADIEARKINFTPGEGSSATDLKVMEMLSDLHLFVVEELKEHTMVHGINGRRRVGEKNQLYPRTLAVVEPVCVLFLDHRQLFLGGYLNYVQLLFVFRDVQIVQSSVSDIPSVQSSFASADRSFVQLFLDQRPQSPSTTPDSSIHFVEDDIQLEDDSALDHFILTSSATTVTTSIDALQESFSTFVATQSKDSRQTNNALGEVMNKIDHVKRVFLDSIAEHNETFRGLFKRSRQEAQNYNNALSLDLKVVLNQNIILSTDLEATRKEVRDIQCNDRTFPKRNLEIWRLN